MGFFSYFVIEIGSINFFLKLIMSNLHIMRSLNGVREMNP